MHCQNTNLGKENSLCYLPIIRAIPDINNSRTSSLSSFNAFGLVSTNSSMCKLVF